MMPVPYCWAMLRAIAALDVVAEAAGLDAEAEVASAPPEPEAVPVGVCEEDAPEDVAVVDSPLVAFSEPQVTDLQPVMPSRSLGWLSTQLVIHCSQTKDGMVWS